MDLLDITERHLHAAIMTWMDAEELAPFLWATGENSTATATPYRADADSEHLAEILTMLGRLSTAEVVGRTAEAWVAPVDEARRMDIRLGDQAALDPSIRTAIIVQACSVSSVEGVAVIATTGLHDDGERWWDISLPTSMHPSVAGPVQEAASLLRPLPPVLSSALPDLASMAEETMNRMGWTLVTSPS